MKIFRENKKLLFFSFFFILLLIGVFAVFINPFSALSPFETPADDTNLYITSGDVIKNFKLDTFDGGEITSGGTVAEYGDKLKVEVGATWKCDTDDMDLLYARQVNDIVYAKYQLKFTNDMNVYTNLDMSDSIPLDKTIDAVKEEFYAGVYAKYSITHSLLNRRRSYIDV
jgi:hypothetical protein